MLSKKNTFFVAATALGAILFSAYAWAAPTPWRVILMPAKPRLAAKLAQGAAAPTGPLIAQNLLKELAADGYPAAHASVNMKNHLIVVRLARFAARSPLSRYAQPGRLVTTARLASISPLLKAAAVAHHSSVSFSENTFGNLTPIFSPLPGPAWSADGIFSTDGPRYAGASVAGAAGQFAYGGYLGSASVFDGIPGLNAAQSSGGRYFSVNGKIQHPTPNGVFFVSLGHVDFAEGGALRPLHITGEINRADLGVKKPFDAGKYWVRAGIEYSTDQQTLGVANWSARQNNLAFFAGIEGKSVFEKTLFSGRIDLIKGVSGDNPYNGLSNILGRFKQNFVAIRFAASGVHSFGGLTVSATAGGQFGTDGTPSVDLSYIGGPGRGSSAYTGTFAAPSGGWGSIQLTSTHPVVFKTKVFSAAVTPFVDLNGGIVAPVIGPTDRLISAQAGIDFSIAPRLAGKIAFSHTISEPAGSEKIVPHNLVNALIVLKF